MDKTQQGDVTIRHENGISTIVFHHPAHNSLPSKLLRALQATIDEAGQHPDTLVVVVKSLGDRTFCAGASFDELISIDTFEDGKRFFLGFANVINAMRKCPKFILVRVQGKAIGGGVGIAAAADYCLATQYASVKLSELAVGIGPFVVGPAIERKVAKSAFGQMAINASEWQTARWAKEKGLFNEVFDSTEQLDAYVEAFAGRLASYNPEAMQKLKIVLWKGTEHWDQLLAERAAASGHLVLSDFAKRAIAAFKSK